MGTSSVVKRLQGGVTFICHEPHNTGVIPQ